MRVLLQSRGDLFTQRAGDTVIVEKLREALPGRGVEAVVDSGPEPDLDGFDWVQLFNVAHRDCHARALNARRQGRPILVSTIYWNQDELLRPGSRERSDYVERWRTRIRRPLWRLAEWVGLPSQETARRRRLRSQYYALGAHGMAREVIEMAHALLPSSPLERDHLLRDFPSARAKRMHMVPHGIDAALFAGDGPVRGNRFLREHGTRDFLLCVGRVERRKNQLGLLTAVRGLGLPVVLVGASVDAEYAARVRERLGPKDVWVESWPHAAMGEIYALARLHALPSFNDIPGLVSLEAAAMGVPVVVSRRGSVWDYLGDRADYCDPGDPLDIRRACEAALARPRPSEELAAYVRSHFSWDHSADRLLEAYRDLPA
jgi:glycosyltransferase involved in cell wall biosynthesis